MTDFLKAQAPAQYDDEVLTFAPRGFAGGISGQPGASGDDPLFEQAKEVVAQAGKASASLLQRRLRLGYARAARLLDILQEHGIVGPPDGSKPRDVLIGVESLGSVAHPGLPPAGGPAGGQGQQRPPSQYPPQSY